MRIETVEQWLGEDNKIGIDIWHKKYQQNDETFPEWIDRVSGGNRTVGELIEQKKFLFGGRILSNRGMQNKGRKITYSNCYVISPPEDNIESIFEVASKLARTFSYGGGCGIDISKLSPRGAKINNSAKETTGAVSFMELYNLVTGLIGQNGRRGALMLSLDCNHPDLEEFIDIKTDLDKITKANISIRVDNEFMEAVINNEYHNLSLIRGETGEVIEKEVYAPNIFRKLCENNWDYAEPGILFWDRIEHHNLLSNNPEFKYAGVNPCAEEPLPAGGSCLLGSINLAEFVSDTGAFKFADFRDTVEVAVVALNDVLDEGLELHPLEEQQNSVRDWRQIGLGIFGLADMLIKMGIEYGSGPAIALCDEIGLHMIDTALKTSAELAYMYGAYPKCNKEMLMTNEFFDNNSLVETKTTVRAYGLRNSQLLTIAPTGSLSTMLGVSGGIEPIFDTHYMRKTESLHGEDRYYKVYTPIVKEYLDKRETIGLDENGDYILPNYIVTSKNITPMKRVKMQAVWQKHIDASISSTINLPEETTVEQVINLYKDAWKKGLKGLTIFRENCARIGILTSDKKKDIPEKKDGLKPHTAIIDEMVIKPDEPNSALDSIEPITRKQLGQVLNGATYVKHNACGKLYITINRDEEDNLVEVFIDPGKSGGCVANAEALGRMASGMMRSGMKIDSIIDTIKGVKCSACTQAKASKSKAIDGMSCGDILARTIEQEYKRLHCLTPPRILNERNDALDASVAAANAIDWDFLKRVDKAADDVEFLNNKCPECKEQLSNSGGCVVCPNCGYSKCD